MIAITPLPAFNDNYLWLLDNGHHAVVVDPGDANVVSAYLKANNLSLSAILITHHHRDHTGGLAELKQQFSCTVYGPKNTSISGIDVVCQHNQSIIIDDLKLTFQVIAVPGHTLDHIAYFTTENNCHANLLFCGDTLFSAGCGRLFEGTACQMWDSIQKLMALPDNTKIFPAHEYTLSNLKFAQKVEPENIEIKEYINKIKQLRENDKPSLPTNLATEKKINPFMRIKMSSVVATATQKTKQKKLSDSEVFATIRQLKDTF